VLVLATCKDNSEREIIVTEQLIRGEQKKSDRRRRATRSTSEEEGGGEIQLVLEELNRTKNSIDAYLSHVKKHTSQFTRCM
jgi:hypothetical protein